LNGAQLLLVPAHTSSSSLKSAQHSKVANPTLLAVLTVMVILYRFTCHIKVMLLAAVAIT
jgi:hypothetical protein